MSVFRALSCFYYQNVFTCLNGPGNLGKLFQPAFYFKGKRISCRRYSEVSSIQHGKASDKNVSSYDSMIKQRRNEAQRSILVQVQSENSYSDLFSYVSQYGSVEHMHHYSISDDMQFFVVEFSNPEDVVNILSACGHISHSETIPVRSPLLWFRAKGGGQPHKTKWKKSRHIKDASLPHLQSGSLQFLSNEIIMQSLSCCTSLSEQVQVLYNVSCLDDLGSRLRFLTARQLELALHGIFPHAKALPFGSSVNGFGSKGSDLDLCLQLDGNSDHRESGEEGTPSMRLLFQTKMIPSNGRAQMQRQMETVGDILQLFLPGCTHIRRILQARVPIIKYHQDFTALECDVTMTNQIAVYMSELLWIMGSLDLRVRPLVFVIRHWARAVNLTNESAGPFITNFTLTLLVLHYLQNCRPHPVLPSLTTLVSMAGPEDRRISVDGVNCTFIRDISKIPSPKNKEPLHSLLYGFFDFYSSFDFQGKGLSLFKGHGDKSGTGITKPDASPLYIENPLERMLNVSKNVSVQELERLKIELCSAAWLMEELMQFSDEEAEEKHSEMKHSASQEAGEKGSLWGLMVLLKPSSSKLKDNRLSVRTTMRINARGRMVKVTDLFNDKSDPELSNNANDFLSATVKGQKR